MQVKDVSDEMVLALFEKGEVGAQILKRLEDKGVPPKVAERKLESMCDRNILEYGVSLNYVWRQ